MRTTSSGRLAIWSPCRAKRITMVNSRPESAQGPTLGRNLDSYGLVTEPSGQILGQQRDA
jgi:hypothetical protein